jgi:hypothetical protein
VLGHLSLSSLQADTQVAARVGATSACAALWHVSRDTGARPASAGSEDRMSGRWWLYAFAIAVGLDWAFTLVVLIACGQ